MLLKVLLGVYFLHVVYAGSWKMIASDRCVGAKNNQYSELTYGGPSTFIVALKLVHKKGQIGCSKRARTHWGCSSNQPTNIIVTDARDTLMYPSPTLVRVRTGGWYDLPGYTYNSPELVFSDPGFRYLYNGQRMRIWYGEDLYNYAESDNQGKYEIIKDNGCWSTCTHQENCCPIDPLRSSSLVRDKK